MHYTAGQLGVDWNETPASKHASCELCVLRACVVQLGTFGWMKDIFFPIWLGFMVLCFVCLETRKQYRRYFVKGSANVCGFMEVINEDHALTKDKLKHRLVPRTEELQIYTVSEFNDKVNLSLIHI